MKKILAAIVVCGILAAVLTSLVPAQNKSASAVGKARPEDEAAIRAAAQAFARAFEKGDAAGVSGAFTEDGEFVDDTSEPIRGREAIAKAYTAFFAKREAVKVTGKTNQIRFLSKDTAIEEGTFTVAAKDTATDSNRYSAFFVRQDGRWLIAMLKEWNDEVAGPTNLNELAWLIGTWEGANADAKVRTSYEWTKSKKFIKCHYELELPGKEKGKKVTTTGTQIMGIDPAVGHIRVWTFDSEGGIGEATWVSEGHRWIIDSRGSLVDGSDTSATHFLTHSGADAFTWRSVRRTHNGESLPDLPTIKINRVK